MPVSDPPPHEVRPCADPNDAGTSWRAEKLKDLVWRAKCLGVRDLPAVQALEREMRDATAALDAMAVEQSAPGYVRPWWKDGEYDEARAEAANDRGMEAYAARRFRDAHADFTEAARLEPRRAGYHANRAAAALKLGDHRAAADDAENALRLDATHVKAMLRFGEAALRGRLDPRRALRRFRDAGARARELGSPRDLALAAKGEARAEEAVAAADASDTRADVSARRGDRAPFPDHESWPDLDAAAEDALSAEETFRFNPFSARFAARFAEACVLCGAPRRALDALRAFEEEEGKKKRGSEGDSRLDLSVNADFAYARASASWRVGDVEEALAALAAFAAAAAADNRRRVRAGAPSVPPPAKLTSLGARLTKLRALRDRGVDAMDDGRPDAAARAFGEALATPLARPLWFRRGPGPDAPRASGRKKNGASLKNGEKRTPYPNAARGDLLRRRAEAILDALDQHVDVDVDGLGVPRRPHRTQAAQNAPSDTDDDQTEEAYDGDDQTTTRSRRALRVAARDLRESLLIDPGDVEARRVRARLRRSVGDNMGAFEDVRAALDAAPGDEALNRAARELAAEATRGGARETRGRASATDGEFRGIRAPVPAAYRALGVSRDADARSIRRAYRRAAATWHPDKWTTRSEAERSAAAAAFRRVAGAYEALGDAKRRRAYDADPESFPIE